MSARAPNHPEAPASSTRSAGAGDIDLRQLDAAIFDLDGVVTQTARVHAAAWKRMFDAYLRQRSQATGEPFQPFSDEDYRRHVDGLPRQAGVAGFLASRGITLPLGTPSDPSERETVWGLGNAKDVQFREILAREGVAPFDDAAALIRDLRLRGVKTALVSSSRNAAAVLEASGLAELFDTVVDGNTAARLHLRGKPDPDIFLAAAERLGVPPERTAVFEDALSGVAAGRAGGFGLVVGVDRQDQAAALRRAGADRVVADLTDLRPSDPPGAQHG